MNASPEVTGRKMGSDAIGVAPMALRVNDACKALSVSRSHLYSMASKGQIKLVSVGGRTVCPVSEIRRLLGEAA